jgi:hypothetical protein
MHNTYSNTKQNFYKIQKNGENNNKKRIIKINIIYNKKYTISDEKTKSEISKENEAESTEIEIYNTETVGNLIKKYCNNKKIKESNSLYLAKKDMKKINDNLTIYEAKIKNNETVYVYKENNNDSEDNERNEIFFNINYEGKNFSFSGFQENTFIDCIKSFIKENGDKNFFFILNGKIIDEKKSLNELNVKNEDVIRIGEIK